MSGLNTGYVLVTAAYNEEQYIETTIRAVVSQTVPPIRWMIVSDGSTDRTDEIVRRYSAEFPFISLFRIEEKHSRNFAAQASAINAGWKALDSLDYGFIANLDADVSFGATYYSDLLHKFAQNPDLGLAGGFICEKQKGKFESRPTNRESSVPHAVQMFRRDCFEAIGGYAPLKYGGPDWHAEVKVRMLGWKVNSFPELPVQHYRPTGSVGGYWKTLLRMGRMDYALGSAPIFEVLKLARRLPAKPYVIGSFIRLFGFMSCYAKKEQRPVSKDFIAFLRREQVGRILSSLPDRPVPSRKKGCSSSEL